MKEYTTPTVDLLKLATEDILTVSLLDGGVDGLGLTGVWTEFDAL